MIRVHLEEAGRFVPDADLQIAATEIYHGLELVTGSILHFERIPGMRLNPILIHSRS